MRLRARLLHVLAIAPAAAVLAGALGPSPGAQAASRPDPPPAPVVLTIDPGHGGLPSTANPTQPFDPGAIGTNGLLEKDITLDVGKRVATLLRQDLASVVLTRTSDVYVTIAQREQISIDAHASLFVSIHCNSFSDPSVGGSLVLYPNPTSQRFAQTLSDALGAELAPDGVSADGIQLRDNWWIHNPVPTGTAEIAYLSDPREAALMATPRFREEVAVAIRNGMEAYDPAIVASRNAIIAWRHAHPGVPTQPAPVGARLPDRGGFPLGAVMGWLLGAIALAVVVRWHDAAARVLVVVIAMIGHALRGVIWIRRAAIRRRRRRLRAHVSEPAHTWSSGHSVYDDLPL